jgi:hypothetical protein
MEVFSAAAARATTGRAEARFAATRRGARQGATREVALVTDIDIISRISRSREVARAHCESDVGHQALSASFGRRVGFV